MSPELETGISRLILRLLLPSIWLLWVLGCGGPSKKAMETEERETANANKEVVLVLTTGDLIQGRIMRETPEAMTLLGRAGVGVFPVSLISRMEEPKPPAVEVYKPKPPAAKYEEQAPMPYAAIRGMRVFHRATCRLLEHQPKSKIVEYSTRQEAINDGLKPCAECNP